MSTNYKYIIERYLNRIIVDQLNFAAAPVSVRHWFLTIWPASPILPRETSRRREFGLSNVFRLVSENSDFAHVRQIITTNHGYLVNIDELLYEILSLRCQ